GTTSCDLWLSLERVYAPHTSSREYTLKTQQLKITIKGDHLREEYNGLKSTLLARQFPTAFSELHGLLFDQNYMIKKTKSHLHRLLWLFLPPITLLHLPPTPLSPKQTHFRTFNNLLLN
ncbi:hypothetical protein R6Q59_036141, partial [Mikania micrantha]